MERKYLCIVCKEKQITESFRENFYYSSNPLLQTIFPIIISTDFKTEGGRLLTERPKFFYNQEFIPFGGICNNCFSNETVKAILESGFLRLE